MSGAPQIAKAVLRVYVGVLLLVSPPAFYICILILKPVGSSEWLKLCGLAVGFSLIVNQALLVPLVRSRVGRSFDPRPNALPGDRLRRLLGLSVDVSVRVELLNLVTLPFLLVFAALWIGRSAWAAVPCIVATTFYSLLAHVGSALNVERVLLPHVREEFQRGIGVGIPTGPLWRRQRWFLVYVFALSLVTALISIVIVLGSHLMEVVGSLVPEAAERSRLLTHAGLGLVGPVLFVLGMLVVLTVIIARRMAQGEIEGTAALAAAIDALAKGRPTRPDWVSTDELGDLAFTIAGAVERLKTLGGGLREAAQQLMTATDSLGKTVQAQMKVLDQNSPVLVEAIYVASQIQQSTEMAGEQAQAVLVSSTEAERLGLQGGTALEQTAAELEAIRAYVADMAGKSRSLGERMGEVLSVTEVVKQLADQSSLLALNAAVEAVRAGAQGKGFSIVAREIRTLADQSLDATRRVREILEDLAGAASQNAKLSEEGHGRVEASLSQVRGSGESLGKLLETVKESTEAAKHIATAVEQQSSRANEVSGAVKSLANVMQGTLRQLGSIEEAQTQLGLVAESVRSMVESYGLVEVSKAPRSRPPASAPDPALTRR